MATFDIKVRPENNVQDYHYDETVEAADIDAAIALAGVTAALAAAKTAHPNTRVLAKYYEHHIQASEPGGDSNPVRELVLRNTNDFTNVVFLRGDTHMAITDVEFGTVSVGEAATVIDLGFRLYVSWNEAIERAVHTAAVTDSAVSISGFFHTVPYIDSDGVRHVVYAREVIFSVDSTGKAVGDSLAGTLTWNVPARTLTDGIDRVDWEAGSGVLNFSGSYVA